MATDELSVSIARAIFDARAASYPADQRWDSDWLRPEEREGYRRWADAVIAVLPAGLTPEERAAVGLALAVCESAQDVAVSHVPPVIRRALLAITPAVLATLARLAEGEATPEPLAALLDEARQRKLNAQVGWYNIAGRYVARASWTDVDEMTHTVVGKGDDSLSALQAALAAAEAEGA